MMLVFARLILLDVFNDQPNNTLQPYCQHSITPLRSNNINTWKGLIQISDTDSISFSYYHNHSTKNIIYIGGGPGHSGQIANYLEIGPLTINKDGSLNENVYYWDFANLLFLDLPAGTGSGSTTIEKLTLGQVVDQYEKFMTELPKQCIEMPLLDNIYIFTSDFGAQYAVNIALRQQSPFSIKGLGMVDPFLSPYTCLLEQANYAFNLGLLDYQERQVQERMILYASDKDASRQKEEYIKMIGQTKGVSGANIYNIQRIQDYIIYEKVIENLLAETQFKAVSKQVYDAFDEIFMKSSVEALTKILDNPQSQVQVLIYQSQFDLTINPACTMRWLYSVDWLLTANFQKNSQSWPFAGQQIGMIKKAGHLEYRLLNNSGQIIHLDQPKFTFDLVKSFLI